MKGAFVSFVNVWFKILYMVKWLKLQVISGVTAPEISIPL